MHISRSLSIIERSELNKQSDIECYKNDIELFFKTNKILSSNDINEMLNIYYKGEKNFVKGLRFNEKTTQDQNSFIWENFIQENIENNLTEISVEDLELWYPLRFLVNVEVSNIKKIISENKHFIFADSIIESCLSNLMNRLLSIIVQPIILDLHRYKKSHEIHKDEKIAFHQYLKNRFSSVEDTLNFYDTYPNLKRIIYENVIFFENNLKSLIYNMDSDLYCFLNKLKIKSKTVTSIHFSEDETHEKGKSVAMISFSDGGKVVYKPKNLLVLNGLNNIFEYFNKQIGQHFYCTKRYIRKDYMFEEYISSSSVKKKEDINNFYFNYGILIGFSYIFKCSDFHNENIIAHDKYPVIIDLETIVQQDIPLLNKQAAHSIKKELLYSYLLPSHKTTGIESNYSYMDLSGLSSGIQYTPFNTLQITNWSTSNMKFEYKKSEIPPCQNTPIYKGVNIDYLNYKQDIIDGFEKFMNHILHNKDEVINLTHLNLADKIVRIVFRDTFKYVQLLNYSYHPNCLKDSLQREKVLQNLWSYNFTDKTIIKHEMNDMLIGDVPTFYINTSKKYLLSSNKEYIGNIFEEPSISLVEKRIRELSNELIMDQKKTILNLL